MYLYADVLSCGSSDVESACSQAGASSFIRVIFQFLSKGSELAFLS